MKTRKAELEMVDVNLLDGKTGRIIDTVELPKIYIDRLAVIAKLKRTTIDAVFCEALMEMMREKPLHQTAQKLLEACS